MSRYYDPQTGRFINSDSLEYLDPETIGGLNLYSYCGNNPVMGVDPTGHFVLWAIVIGVAIIGGAIGGAIGDSQGKTGWDLAESILQGAVLGAMLAGVAVMVSGLGVGLVAGWGGISFGRKSRDRCSNRNARGRYCIFNL